MIISRSKLQAINNIEDLIHQDVGRNMERAFAKTKGNLSSAAISIASSEKPSIGIMTGFFIEKAIPPAAETDGPLGAALLAFALSKIGVNCRVITDSPCKNVCQAALNAAGANTVPLDIVKDEYSLEKYQHQWNTLQLTHVISTERPGRSVGGVPRNMNGQDILDCVSFDDLFKGGNWRKIAIGDGGNEIGMGSLPYELVAQDVKHGPSIACVTGADDLITAGVSNWGVNALIGSLAVLKPEWQQAMLQALEPAREIKTLRYMVEKGAVDGICGSSALTVDNLALEVHLHKTSEIVDIVKQSALTSVSVLQSKRPPQNRFKGSVSLNGNGQRLTA